MASNKAIRIGPVTVAAAVANLFNPPTLTGGTNVPGAATYVVIRHLRVVNRTAGAVNFSGFVGATGVGVAGTEFMGSATPVPANSYIDWYGALRLDTGDFLTGLASAATSLTIEGEGEIGIA